MTFAPANPASIPALKMSERNAKKIISFSGPDLIMDRVDLNVNLKFQYTLYSGVNDNEMKTKLSEINSPSRKKLCK